MANGNCAASILAALINDGGVIVSEAAANTGAANPSDTNIYVCIDLGTSGVVCIRRPKTGAPIRVKI